MNNLIHALQTQLFQAVETPEPIIEQLESRAVFLLAPLSMLGQAHGASIASACSGLVAAIDDVSTEATINSAPRWTSAQFIALARAYPDAIALDFSCNPGTRGLVQKLCKEAGIERFDCVVAQAQLKRWAVYEAVGTYRRRTLERFDDFLKLADRFDDDLSRATLYANLLFRVTYDRSHLLQIWANPADEYFSYYPDGNTFQLGNREHYCDCGAYRGPIVQKFLEVTAHQYASITAFEPDPANFAILQQLSRHPLHNFHAINKAVSNEPGELSFHSDGSMGSHVSNQGNISVTTTRLDDELETLTFLKLDVEGFEPQTLQGAARLLRTHRPRIAAAAYHATHDVLKIVEQIDQHAGDDYHYRLRQHYGSYYYDLVLYASPIAGVEPPPQAR